MALHGKLCGDWFLTSKLRDVWFITDKLCDVWLCICRPCGDSFSWRAVTPGCSLFGSAANGSHGRASHAGARRRSTVTAGATVGACESPLCPTGLNDESIGAGLPSRTDPWTLHAHRPPAAFGAERCNAACRPSGTNCGSQDDHRRPWVCLRGPPLSRGALATSFTWSGPIAVVASSGLGHEDAMGRAKGTLQRRRHPNSQRG